MSAITTVATAATSVAIAFGIGFLMQHGAAAPADTDAEARAQDGTAVRSVMMSRNTVGDAVFGVPTAEIMPTTPINNIQTVAAIEMQYAEHAVPDMGTIYATPFGECQSQLAASPKPVATVELIVTAPCKAESSFLIKHNGLVFAGITDETGSATLNVPALTETASFAVSFQNVEVAKVSLDVPDVGLYDRAVLQWRGSNFLQLHALEFGAGFGDTGHVWSASANNATMATTGDRGFLVRLGAQEAEIPYVAEVYTFPSGLRNRDGQITLQIGAAVTEENCARDIKAQTIQTNAGKMLIGKDISVRIPSCDQAGESVMVADIYQDVTLVSR